MAKKCGYCREISSDVFICDKYRDYCLLDFPDLKQCKKIYGTDEDEVYLQDAEYEDDIDTDNNSEE